MTEDSQKLPEIFYMKSTMSVGKVNQQFAQNTKKVVKSVEKNLKKKLLKGGSFKKNAECCTIICGDFCLTTTMFRGTTMQHYKM